MYDESKYGRCELCGGKLVANWYIAEETVNGIKTGRVIKRAELKKKDIEYVKGKYNIEVNDDIADAIGIADSYFIAQAAANQCAW